MVHLANPRTHLDLVRETDHGKIERYRCSSLLNQPIHPSANSEVK